MVSAGIAGGYSSGSPQLSNHVKVPLYLFREGLSGSSGCRNCSNFRPQKYQGTSPGQKGIPGKTKKSLSFSLFLCEKQKNKGKHQKNADHDGDIVIGKNAYCQCDKIQNRLSLTNQFFQSHHNQGKQGHAVHPHNVPAVSCHKTGQGIGRGKHQCR